MRIWPRKNGGEQESDLTAYDRYHAPRYEFLLERLGQLGVSNESRVLDIGPSRLTELIRDRFHARVDTLGFGEDQPGDRGNHFEFDLNRTQQRDNWRVDLPHYDFVVMAEVIEHLYTAPQLVLGFVKTLLRPNGLLILQTPNAASLTKRIKLLLGRHPYEKIRSDPRNPGHYREYTMGELRALAEELGFCVERCETAFYFDARHAHDESGSGTGSAFLGGLKNLVYRALPPSLREGITMVWRAV